jgi:Flp pilus assembly protein TadG
VAAHNLRTQHPRRLAPENGQALVIMAVWLAALMGMAAVAIDVGSWYRAQRALQARVDAAALAGAQELPWDTTSASTVASQYGTKNGGIAGARITFTNNGSPDDTIEVAADKTETTFFARTLGIGSVQVSAKAAAKASLLGSAQYVAPIVVSKDHPLLGGSGCPCFGTSTSLPLGKTGAPGAFALVNLDGARGGDGGPGTLADWILNGFQDVLDLGDYFSNTGAKWDSSEIQDALAHRLNKTLLFPVFDRLVGGGSNAQYHVIAWVGFYLTGFDARGVDGDIFGYFTKIVWTGLPASSPGGGLDLGARTISLVG